jgi:hypothetical protein
MTMLTRRIWWVIPTFWIHKIRVTCLMLTSAISTQMMAMYDLMTAISKQMMGMSHLSVSSLMTAKVWWNLVHARKLPVRMENAS